MAYTREIVPIDLASIGISLRATCIGSYTFDRGRNRQWQKSLANKLLYAGKQRESATVFLVVV